MNNIFVGNLSYKSTKEDVQKLFEPFGTVANVAIIEGKKSRSRGYGFVDMPNEDERNKAIAALNGKEFMWWELSVEAVAPKVKVEGETKPRKSAVVHAKRAKPVSSPSSDQVRSTKKSPRNKK